uniref:Maturation n=1 Tax=Leviviridae sp. TaxID=2027243 RepID=A0A142D889_9VIRU|nr:maturation [Leviviridae sp.]
MPYSFVIDWFIPVGDYLTMAMAFAGNGVTITSGSLTYSTVIDQQWTTSPRGSSGFTCNSTQSSRIVSLKTRELRVPSYPTPSFLIHFPRQHAFLTSLRCLNLNCPVDVLNEQYVHGVTNMSLIKNIVLKDGKAVPADHTFVPACPQVGDKTPATWFEKNANSPIGWRKITLLVRPVPNGTSKVTIRVSDPTLALTADGCCVDVNTRIVS